VVEGPQPKSMATLNFLNQFAQSGGEDGGVWVGSCQSPLPSETGKTLAFDPTSAEKFGECFVIHGEP